MVTIVEVAWAVSSSSKKEEGEEIVCYESVYNELWIWVKLSNFFVLFIS